MLGELITSKTRLRLLIKFFISEANKGYLNGLATEMGESTNAIRKELNHLQGAGYLEKVFLNLSYSLCIGIESHFKSLIFNQSIALMALFSFSNEKQILKKLDK